MYERYWLYAVVDPETNRLLHVRLYPTRTQAITEMFLSELREKHLMADAELDESIGSATAIPEPGLERE